MGRRRKYENDEDRAEAKRVQTLQCKRRKLAAAHNTTSAEPVGSRPVVCVGIYDVDHERLAHLKGPDGPEGLSGKSFAGIIGHMCDAFYADYHAKNTATAMTGVCVTSPPQSQLAPDDNRSAAFAAPAPEIVAGHGLPLSPPSTPPLPTQQSGSPSIELGGAATPSSADECHAERPTPATPYVVGPRQRPAHVVAPPTSTAAAAERIGSVIAECTEMPPTTGNCSATADPPQQQQSPRCRWHSNSVGEDDLAKTFAMVQLSAFKGLEQHLCCNKCRGPVNVHKYELHYSTPLIGWKCRNGMCK